MEKIVHQLPLSKYERRLEKYARLLKKYERLLKKYARLFEKRRHPSITFSRELQTNQNLVHH